ncbi:MAG: SCO family protein [Pseudomonadota bacterium]
MKIRALAGAVALAAAIGSAQAGAGTPAPSPFPLPVEVRFDLVDQTGRSVDQDDFIGQPFVLFFGYANCESICTVALPNIAHAMDILGDDGDRVLPVMITIDPERDTPEYLAEAMPLYHERFVGLTGQPAAVEAAWAAFQVQVTEIARDPAGLPIFAHGSFVYLIDADGKIQSLLPPIIGPERMAELIEKHLLAPES